MSSVLESDSVIETYLFETSQILTQLEEAILQAESEEGYSLESINLIFRYMHTVKGSSAMMGFTEIGSLSHAMEDLFFYLRENPSSSYDLSALSDLVFEGIDFTKLEIQKIKNKDQVDGNAEALIKKIKAFLCAMKENMEQESEIEESLKNYQAQLFFVPGAGMESIRMLGVLKNLQGIAESITSSPDETMSDEEATSWIIENGAQIDFLSSRNLEEVTTYLQETVFLENLQVKEKNSTLEEPEANTKIDRKEAIETEVKAKEDIKIEEIEADLNSNADIKKIEETIQELQSKLDTNTIEEQDDLKDSESVKTSTTEAKQKKAVLKKAENTQEKTQQTASSGNASNQNFISVNVEKLDKLMDLVGEMVITKAMVIQNPEVNKLEIESFQKAARQLQKITSDLQDMVMSIRMVPLSATFMKMNRIVRDMSKKLNKKVNLEVIGEETEVDKNIIEKISDPLMHIIRNAIDHGIEDASIRENNGKDMAGKIVLEARNVGSEVIVSIRDDGQGLNRTKIYQKAKEKGIVFLPMEDMEDRDIYNFILHPGFSTKEEITEFSGRGVGMDVVSKNIESVGGMVFVDSVEGKGTTVSLKIPLTLAIIDGMNIEVGTAKYTIPIGSIRESFQPKEESIIKDPDGNEMIIVRGHVYPVISLHELYSVKTEIHNYNEGILIMVETEEKAFCLFADRLLGEQQVVVKTLPSYLKRFKKIGGVGGCTLLGDGSISLILDIGELGTLINEKRSE